MVGSICRIIFFSFKIIQIQILRKNVWKIWEKRVGKIWMVIKKCLLLHPLSRNTECCCRSKASENKLWIFFWKVLVAQKNALPLHSVSLRKNEPAALKSDKLYQRKSKQNYFTGSCRIVTQKSWNKNYCEVMTHKNLLGKMNFKPRSLNKFETTRM